MGNPTIKLNGREALHQLVDMMLDNEYSLRIGVTPKGTYYVDYCDDGSDDFFVRYDMIQDKVIEWDEEDDEDEA